MGSKIRLEMSDWVYNAGLVGLVNILRHSGHEIIIHDQFAEIELSDLEKFEEKIFNYLIDKYEENLSWYKIVSYEGIMNYHENNDFIDFAEKDLTNLNKYIKNTLKYYLNSASYKSAYLLFLNNEIDIVEKAKAIEIIKLNKGQDIKGKILEVQHIYKQIKLLINFCKESEHKKYLAAKNVIYTLINKSWDGVCFLNPQTKEKDVYLDYKEYFVDPAVNHKLESEAPHKYNCYNCNDKIKNLSNNLSFIKNVGFDVSKKSSHIWDFNNDISICPICKLVYSCIPAGIAYAHDSGIYVNDNNSLDRALRVNNKIKTEILKEHEVNSNLTYRSLVSSIQEQFQHNIKYELAEIQVINYKDGQYKFNMLSKKMINTIQQSKKDLSSITNGGFKEVNTYFNIYELVIERILNNQNMFTLINKLLLYKLSIPKDCKFSNVQILKVLKINTKVMEGMGYMQNIERDIIKVANTSGYYLRQEYKLKGAKDKLSGISYRLLNALKTNNRNMFMDTLLNCYLYSQKTVPSIFLEALKDDELYKTIGYAFVTGLIEGKEITNVNGGVNNEQ